MLTQTLINTLKNDSTLLDLLGVAQPNKAPIRTHFLSIPKAEKFIVVSYTYGETNETGYEFGTITVEVYVKATVRNPITVLDNIVSRVLAILDLKGSQLQDEFTSKVYIVRKTDFTHLYDNKNHFNIGRIDFLFYCEE